MALPRDPELVLCSDCLDWLVRRRDREDAAAGVVRIVNDEPIFLVGDVARAADHYTKLGFDIEYHDETYAFAQRDDLTIHLAQSDGQPIAGHLYLHVTDADRVADEWRNVGADVEGPHDYDYGKREGSHTDPDGNRVRFGSPLDSN